MTGTKTKRIIAGLFLALVLGLNVSVLHEGLFGVPPVHAQQTYYEDCIAAGRSAEDCFGLPPKPTATTPGESDAYKDCVARTGSEEDCSNLLTKPTTTPPKESEQLKKLIEMIIMVEKAFLSVSVPLNIVIGKLLSNDWVYLDGDAYGAIRSIWLLMRNIVNVVFAGLLLYIAVGQIWSAVGGGNEKNDYNLKRILPGFIFGLVFVNFSLLACRVILDIGNLATTAAFSIVHEVGPNIFATNGGAIDEAKLTKLTFCWPTKIGREAQSKCKESLCLHDWAKPDDKLEKGKNAVRKCMGKTVKVAFGKKNVEKLCDDESLNKESLTGCVTGSDFAMGWTLEAPKDAATAIFGSRNAMVAYTNSIFRLPEILTLYDEKTDLHLETAAGIAVTTLITVIFAAMIILINIMLFFALGIRLVLIWMILIFSPLMALEMVSGGKFVKGFLTQAKFKDGLIRGLVGLAFMPAVAGIVLSLGFIIFHVLSGVIARTALYENSTQTFNIPPFDIEVTGGIIPMFSTLGEFIVAMLMLIILWRALFDMMKTNEYIGGVVKKIDDIGKSIAGSAKMIPFIPMPGKKGKDGQPDQPAKLVGWGSAMRGINLAEEGFKKQMGKAEVEGLMGTEWFEGYAKEYVSGYENITKGRSLLNAPPWGKEQYNQAINIVVQNKGVSGTSEEASVRMELLKKFMVGMNIPEDAKKNLEKAMENYVQNYTNGGAIDELNRQINRALFTHTRADHVRGDAVERFRDPNPNRAHLEEGTTPASGISSSASRIRSPDQDATGATRYHLTISNASLNGGNPMKIENIPSSAIEALETRHRQYGEGGGAGDLRTALHAILVRNGGLPSSTTSAGLNTELPHEADVASLASQIILAARPPTTPPVPPLSRVQVS